MGWQSVGLQCAAAWTVAKMANLADARTSCYKSVVALAERLQPLSQHLRKKQKGAVAKVAAKMHVAFLAVAVVLLNWPDTNLPSRYITGFRSLGMLETTCVSPNSWHRSCASRRAACQCSSSVCRPSEQLHTDG